MAKDHELRVFLDLGSAAQQDHAEQPHHEDIEEGQEHEAGFSQTEPSYDHWIAESGSYTRRPASPESIHEPLWVAALDLPLTSHPSSTFFALPPTGLGRPQA